MNYYFFFLPDDLEKNELININEWINNFHQLICNQNHELIYINKLLFSPDDLKKIIN